VKGTKLTLGDWADRIVAGTEQTVRRTHWGRNRKLGIAKIRRMRKERRVILALPKEKA
jgi:hypothetical protein